MGYADNFWSSTRTAHLVVMQPFTYAGREYKIGEKIDKLPLTLGQILGFARAGLVDFK